MSVSTITGLFNKFTFFRKAIEDVLVSMSPQIVAGFTAFLTSVLLARGLHSAGLGKYVLVLSIANLVSGMSDVGISDTAIRFASRAVSRGDIQKQRAVMRWTFRVRVLMLFFISIAFFALTPTIATSLWHDSNLTHLLQVSVLIGISMAIGHVPMMYFQSLKQFKMNSTISVVQTVITFASILVIAWLKLWSLDLVVIVSLISSALGTFTFIVLVPKDIFYKSGELFGLKTFTLRGILKTPSINKEDQLLDGVSINVFTLYMVISSLSLTILLTADVWLQGFFLVKSQIGVYSVALRFTYPLLVLQNAIQIALWPRASAITSHSDVGRLLRTTFRISLIIAGAVVVYAIVIPLLAPLIFGTEYFNSILVGQVSCIRYGISILLLPISLTGFSFGLISKYAKVNVLRLVIVLLINVLLLPVIGPLGSSFALIASDAVGLSVIGALIFKKLATIT
jgi:O-antigen/teichoic acid export membrane protein